MLSTRRRVAGTVALAALALGACSGDDSASDDSARSTGAADDIHSTTTVSGGLSSTALLSGTCVELAGFLPDVRLVPSAITPIACDQPHKAEVYGSFAHPAAGTVEWPGDVDVAAYAEDECLARFQPAIGRPYTESALDFAVLRPTEATWAEGDRAIACIAYGTDGLPLTGTILGSGK